MNKKLCDYGCGTIAKYVLQNKKNCCKDNSNKCVEQRRKNSEGLIIAYKTGKKTITENFEKSRDWRKDKNVLIDMRVGIKYKKFIDIFCINSPVGNSRIKKLIIKNNLFEYKCQGVHCKLSNQWLGKKLVLDLDHINGINNDNRIENIRFLCPNCHSQTETFKNKNRKSNVSKKNISDLMIKKLIKKKLNNNKICLLLDISIGNYKRINNLRIKIENEKKCIKCNTQLKTNSKTGMCMKCFRMLNRKIDRPSYEELINSINKEGYVRTGKKFNVSDNAIRKWVKAYEINLSDSVKIQTQKRVKRMQK